MATVTPVVAIINEVQTIVITGSPSGGTFTVALDGDDSDAINFDDDNTEVQTALEGITAVGAGQVTVTGTNPSFTVTFVGTLAHTPISQLTLSDNSLTGGTAPNVTLATTTQGTNGDGLLTPATMVRYLGYSLRETAGAVATVHLRDGSATGRILATVRFTASQSRHAWRGPQGVWANAGIYYEWVAGTIEGTVRYV